MAQKPDLAFTIVWKEGAGQWWIGMIDPSDEKWQPGYGQIAPAIGVTKGWLVTTLIREYGAEMNNDGCIGWASKEGAMKGMELILDIYLGKFLAAC